MNYIQYLRDMIGRKPVIMVAAGVAVFNEKNQLLMHHRKEDKLWGLVGGFMDIGETVEEAARREVYEEVGIELGELTLIGVYDYPIHTLPNGDQVQSVMVMYKCDEYFGEPKVCDDEGLSVEFVSYSDIPEASNLKLPWVINEIANKYMT